MVHRRQLSRFARSVAPVLAFLASIALPAEGQRHPVASGDVVRFANAESTSSILWTTGRVASIGGDSLRLADNTVTPLLRLNESIRLQVDRGRRRKTTVGGVIGFFVGGVIGMMRVENGTSVVDPMGGTASLEGAFSGAAIGALVGAVVGSRFGPRKWEEVLTGPAGALAASMQDVDVDSSDVVNVEWWTPLEAGQVDVAAILEIHGDSLSPIEGIWERGDDEGVVAIVRESRYQGIDYVAYAPSGQIIGAANGTTDGGSYYFRFPPGTTRYPARLADGMLMLRSPGDTLWQWQKRSDTPDSTFLAASDGVTLLNPVVVEAPRINETLDRVGFFQRRRGLSGTFLTRDDILAQNPRNTSDLMRRIPGIAVTESGTVRSPRETSTCGGVGYYMNGVHVQGHQISEILPNIIAGIEVYSSSASVPARYQMASNIRCGVVLIWTVDGREEP